MQVGLLRFNNYYKIKFKKGSHRGKEKKKIILKGQNNVFTTIIMLYA